MFLKFKTMEERSRYGGSAFLEIQYCQLPIETSELNLVSVDLIQHWKQSSLYVYIDEMDDFYNEYKDIFQMGLYNNLSEGIMDMYGINYYNRNKVKEMIKRLNDCRPKEYKIMLEWLANHLNQNGFYILGI